MTIGTGTQCQKHGLLYVEECYECLREERDALAARVDDLKTAGRQARDDATAALDLVSRIRMALNDNGKRMQDELLEYCRELAALPARVAELEAWQKEVANGLGFLNQPEGQAGYEVAEPSEIIHDWHECEAYTDRCRSALENIKRHIRESMGEENARFSTIYNIAAEATEG